MQTSPSELYRWKRECCVSCIESQAKVIAKHHRDINAIDIEYVARQLDERMDTRDTMINLPFNRGEVDATCYIAYSLRQILDTLIIY